MTKQIILIFAVLCSVQVQANSRYTERDTVQHEFFHDATELFQPLQPVYLDGVVVPRTGSGNWFVSVTGGATAFLGTPLGCEDLFGRVKPSYNLAVGKWFTPAVGARIHYSGLQFKDAGLSTKNYHSVHGCFYVIFKTFLIANNVYGKVLILLLTAEHLANFFKKR